MVWNLTADRPVYVQLVEHLQMAIIVGEFTAGGKLPSVRELAESASVNPNTMQKALQEMETMGLVNTQRTAGRTITEDVKMIEQLKSECAEKNIADFLENMHKLGFEKNDIIELIKKVEEEK
ncbi:MAG: GntR family transcriptional regulator [Oscillospiraceae bacterium]